MQILKSEERRVEVTGDKSVPVLRLSVGDTGAVLYGPDEGVELAAGLLAWMGRHHPELLQATALRVAELGRREDGDTDTAGG